MRDERGKIKGEIVRASNFVYFNFPLKTKG